MNLFIICKLRIMIFSSFDFYGRPLVNPVDPSLAGRGAKSKRQQGVSAAA